MVKSTILSAWGTFHKEKVHPASEALAIIFVFKKIFMLTSDCYEIERININIIREEGANINTIESVI